LIHWAIEKLVYGRKKIQKLKFQNLKSIRECQFSEINSRIFLPMTQSLNGKKNQTILATDQ